VINKTYENSQVDIKYNTAVINNITGLTAADLESFADTYRPTVQWISDVSDYEIQRCIKDKFFDGNPKINLTR